MARRRIAKVRVEMVKEKSVYCKTQEISSPELAAEFARSLYYENIGDELRCPTKEVMIVCCIDAKSKPLVVEYVSQGTSSSSLIGIKEIFMSAILSNADGIICFHNHPSGNPEPSMADELMTKRIREAGKILGIPMRDSIVIGDSSYYSFEEQAVYPWKEDKIFEKVG